MVKVAIDRTDGGVLGDDYERYIAGEAVLPRLRRSIRASWERCRLMGHTADEVKVLYQDDLDWEGDLVSMVRPVLDQIEPHIFGHQIIALLSDEKGRLLDRRVPNPQVAAWLDEFWLAPGFGISEETIGTNGMGTALAERRPAYVYGSEHVAKTHQIFACAATPIRDPLSGRLLGILDLSARTEHADLSMLSLVCQLAGDIEQRLLNQVSARERALLATFHETKRRAYGNRMAETHALRANHSSSSPDSSASSLSLASLGWPCDRLTRDDRRLLQEKAAELISYGSATIAEVLVSRGQRVILMSRPLQSAMSKNGIVVEAVLCGDAPRHFAMSAPAVAHNGLGGAASAAGLLASSAPTAPERPLTAGPPAVSVEPRSSTGWLVAVGEPGISQLAMVARQRLEFLYEAGVRIGTTLDVTRTAEELTQAAVPRFADFAAVDLPDSVPNGEEPINLNEGMRRVAVSAVQPGFHLYQVGDLVKYVPSTPQARCVAAERSVLAQDLSAAPGWKAQDPFRGEKVLEAGVHSLITVPLRARGAILGVVSFYRSGPQAPFEEDDLSLAEELVTRAAVCIDNARRYTREHVTTLALQRSLLPHAVPEQNAVDVAYRYRPAHSSVGGDWFDVIPLSGARVALVVGDVVGHGLHASATMGRLRTAVQNFSALDLPADEVLTRLDDLVCRLDLDEARDHTSGDGIIGATCLYAVYDPTTRRCTLACAGHPTPALLLPDGTVRFPEVPPGPPLGLGGLPFESIDLDIPEGSQLILFTDGLIERRRRDIDAGLERLGQALARPSHASGRTPEQTAQALLEALLPDQPDDDVALLVAQTRVIAPTHMARWDVPADPAAVSQIRGAVTRRLAEWDMDELAFATELIVSELVTNAIRHAAPHFQLRLIHDRALICEVSDSSGTSPRLRRATTTDEGGRGLFLAAQLAGRWGTRYTATGKVIWTEQPIPVSSPKPPSGR